MQRITPECGDVFIFSFLECGKSLGRVGADAIDAVNDHYELNFDSDSFAKNYKCLVNEVPLEKCGVKKCPECKKEKKSESSLKSIFSSKPPETRYVQYVKRTYFRVPVKWTPPDACTNVVCETPAAPRCSGTPSRASLPTTQYLAMACPALGKA